MIDFSAIEGELSTVAQAAYTFKSTETGRIRETVANSQMPALDVAVVNHEGTQRAGYEEGRSSIVILLRFHHAKPATAESRLKLALEAVRAAIETHTGWTSFAAAREITSRATEAPGGDGSVIRAGTITLTALT